MTDYNLSAQSLISEPRRCRIPQNRNGICTLAIQSTLGHHRCCTGGML